VDVELDLALIDVPVNEYEEAYHRQQSWYGDNATNWSMEGSIIKYTVKVGPSTNNMSMGDDFSYLGFGGPDITLDIVLGEDGRPTSIKVIYDMPPGIPMPSMEVHP